MKRSVGLLIVVSAAVLAPTSAQCISIVDFICRVSTLSMLCASVTQVGIGTQLNSGNWTVFAPTNNAFFRLGDRLGVVLGNPDVLAGVISYHTVEGIVNAEDLTCSGSLEMANGQTSRTECRSDSIYQKGQGNGLGAMPQVVASNINTCSGVVHMVDEVLLPAELGPESQIPAGCKSIADIVCESSLFSTLCTAITQAGLREALSGGSWTIFAPTNDAFARLGNTLTTALADNTLLTDILLTHAIESVIYSNSLECGGTLTMANSQQTSTVCHADSIFQVANGNEASSLPQIELSIYACNGVLHLVSNVLLPSVNESEEAPMTFPIVAPMQAPVGECRSIVEIACSTENLSTLCSAVTQADLVGTLSEGSYTIFAPTNIAFSNLGATLDTVLADNNLLTDILLYHLVEGAVYSTDLVCDSEVVMANGQTSRTFCENDDIFLAGQGNEATALPLVVLVDLAACNNSVLHAVDEVILPML
ncbi:hypothetical protein FisN_7Hu388 [Fistulifera solaris]|uniref:FAS1 domain-containing protein n=1 Tax=Fistulifera solaris TaxID=1519565 RepID=A0A1Z5KSQ2_FISSO|nr:hypothetical protein FisN_7Hu388 [Fistulifera solaris]|eukprot:GAX29021.1 hypothetical protein FisN_7Hu388 [Fistulifera solaris]